MSLGRVLIAAFMVAIFLGPRRWMAWAAQLRDRSRLVRTALRARRTPGAEPHEPPRDGADDPTPRA